MSNVKYYHCCVQYDKEIEGSYIMQLQLLIIRHVIVEDWRCENKLFPMGTFMEIMNDSCSAHYIAFKKSLVGSVTVCEIEKNEARKLRELPDWCGCTIKIEEVLVFEV